MVRGAIARVPLRVLRVLAPVVPTYIWVGTTAPASPLGPPTTVAPQPVRT
jgi:hypothetical protein